MHVRKTMHGVDEQYQYVDWAPRGRVIQNDRGQINGESTSMVWPTLGSRTAKKRTEKNDWCKTLWPMLRCQPVQPFI